MRRQKLIIVSIYILLLAGGLWHALGVLQNAMRFLAGPMIMAICLVLCFDFIQTSAGGAKDEGAGRDAVRSNHFRKKFLLWSVFVFLASFLLELLGVQTAAIFGVYAYQGALQPVLWSVPVAIGFAWLGMIISAAALAQRIGSFAAKARPEIMSLLIALFMVVFDFFMEPAATKLGYWQWTKNAIPARNYFSWFVFGCLFSYIGVRLGLFKKKLSSVAVHAYVAQLLYFLIVNLSR